MLQKTPARPSRSPDLESRSHVPGQWPDPGTPGRSIPSPPLPPIPDHFPQKKGPIQARAPHISPCSMGDACELFIPREWTCRELRNFPDAYFDEVVGVAHLAYSIHLAGKIRRGLGSTVWMPVSHV